MFSCLEGNGWETEIERRLEFEDIDQEFIDVMFKTKDELRVFKEEEYQSEFNRTIFADDEVYRFGGKIVESFDVELDSKLVAYQMGTTANIVMVKDGFVYVANSGDSLAVIYQDGKASKINLEHNMRAEREIQRIKASGSRIINNRIEGKLNLTRAIGDFMFKQGKDLTSTETAVIAYPEIKKLQLKDNMEFILMGCDGVWDCLDIQKVCQYISEKLKEKTMTKSEIIRKVFEKIFSVDHPLFGSDNMSCILIDLTEKERS